jgi:hypothetical protein
MSAAWRRLPTLSHVAGSTGLVGIALCAIGAFVDANALLQGWLATWLLLLGISLAAMVEVMIHELTGGEWGSIVRPSLEAAMLTLPFVAVLALPIAFGLPHLFPWARPDEVAQSALLQAKRWYLSPAAFVIRNAMCLMLWSALAIVFARVAVDSGARTGDHRNRPRARRLAVSGLLVYLVTVTFAGYDWIASPVADWSSAAIGLRLGVAQFVAAFGFAVAFAVFLRLDAGAPYPSPRDCGDLGNLLLTFVMMWAYIAFTQYLIVWGEDLPAETSWYWPRAQTSWRWLSVAVATLTFIVPAAAMLFRRVKRDARALAVVCGLALLGQWLDCVWLTLPSWRTQGFELHWLDFAALAAEGGLWLAVVTLIFARRRTPLDGARSEAIAYG